MGRLIEVVGNYAEKPFHISHVDVNVYCIEELCYVFCNNAFLLDKSIVNLELAKWVDEECGLPELAKSMYTLIHQKGSPSALVGIVLNYVHYGSEQEQREIEELFRESADMDICTKRKNYADHLVLNGRYAHAVTEYDLILDEMRTLSPIERSMLYHNRGVAMCRLFNFSEAAKSFLKAVEEDPSNRESEVQYLGALRMLYSDEEYISFIADHKMWYEPSLELERRMTEIKNEFVLSQEKKQLEELLDQRYKTADVRMFYDELSKRVATMKWNYREMITEP